MSHVLPPLDFSAVDKATITAPGKHLQRMQPGPLGPMFELMWLRQGGLDVPSLSDLPKSRRSSALLKALNSNQLIKAAYGKQSAGFVRTLWAAESGDVRLYKFCSAAQAGAEAAGISRDSAQQLVGALGELEDNIHLHSDRPDTGVLGFAATEGVFEFVIADAGIGVLQSLRKWSGHHSIKDHGEALQAATQEGASRFGPRAGHGTGFRQLFVGLYNLKALIRFRSGDHVLSIDGRVLGQEKAELFRVAAIPGFITSVVCRPH